MMMMKTNSSRGGLVLQGYFRVERFRGGRASATAGGAVQAKGKDLRAGKAPRPKLMGAAGRSGAMAGGAAQVKGRNFWVGKAPRPDLMVAGVVQSKRSSASSQGHARSGAPRPDMLPMAMRCPVAQGKGPADGWTAKAPRPELLPGMGRPTLGTVAQRRGGAADGVVTLPVSDGRLRLIGPGKPLDDGLREKMEGFFGADFSGVRVHEGPTAQAMGALALTLGETLHFAPGLYDPTTRDGIELLGHELTHVVQQREGRVSNPYGRGVAIVQDPGLEAEADAIGREVAEEIWAGTGVQDPLGGRAKRNQHWVTFERRGAAQANKSIGGVLQRQVELTGLHDMCANLVGSYPGAVEFQAMSIEETVIVAGNKSSGGVAALVGDVKSWDTTKTTQIIGATVMQDTGVTKGKDIKRAADTAAAAGKQDAGGLVILQNDVDGGGDALHAEQKLLHMLADLMQAQRFFGVRVVVAGRNPPCGSCRAVLDAFAEAYEECMYGQLVYDKTPGQSRNVKKLDLASLYPGAESRFEDFVKAYTKAL